MGDHSNFDKVRFATLLEKARGKRSINQYANSVNISAAHISRLLRKMVPSPPSPETIGKLANDAYNDVTYDELMNAAGHISEMAEKNPSKINRKQSLETEKKFFQIILSDLYSRDFDWKLNKKNKGTTDLEIEISDWTYSRWYIQIAPSVDSLTIKSIYGQIALSELLPDIKYSIAVGNREEYDLIIFNRPKSIRGNIYVMLLDLTAGEIIEEKKLCHY